MDKRQPAKRRPTKKTKKRSGIAYPLIFFLLLCVGVYLVMATFKAKADGDIQVTANIPGPAISSPATITSPTDGSHFGAVPITVTGTCPADAAYVKIFRNNVMSGSAICQSNTFSLDIDLFEGQNNLVAHVFNVTDDEGPASAPVHVFYDKPAPAAPSSGSGSSSSGSGSQSGSGSGATGTAPFVITTPFVYKGYYVNDTMIWPVDISGGTAPYAFNIDWGDGSNSVISRKNDSAFNITHKYAKPGGYKGSYNIKIQASDSEENYAYMQFFVIVTNKNDTRVTGLGNIYNKPPPALNNLGHWLIIAWPVYGALIVMVTCFKLGEREELHIIRRKGLPHRHA